jgi:alpha-tubulin suppressor-like RCC1 family protein
MPVLEKIEHTASVLVLSLFLTSCSSSSPNHPPDGSAADAARDRGGTVDGGPGGDLDANLDADLDAALALDADLTGDIPPTTQCPTPCHKDATCKMDAGKPKCVCNQGFTGDGLTCTDMDECANGTAKCKSGDPCHNIPGSYFCGCGPGQEWDGAACAKAGVRRVSTGDSHACRVTSAGKLHCWGKNNMGQVGDGTKTYRSVMTPVKGSPQDLWQSVMTSRNTSCALRSDNSLWCWGWTLAVLPGSQTATEPQKVGPFTDWEQVDASQSHACGIRKGGVLVCWGGNASGQLGQASPLMATPDSPITVMPGATWSYVSTGSDYTCAVKADGTLWCWGNNFHGNLGDGTTTQQKTPKQVGTSTDWRVVAAGANMTTCGIRLDGSLFCWGLNSRSQVGCCSGTQQVTTPQKVGGASSWRVVQGDGFSTCGIRYDDTVWCWGAMLEGFGTPGAELKGSLGGSLDVATSSEPTSQRRTFACAIKHDDTTWCWGSNLHGQLALGTAGSRADPARVGTQTWTRVEPNTSYTCGLRASGTLWCWGEGAAVGLINAATKKLRTQTPVQVDPSSDWKALHTGYTSLCVIRQNGTLWCSNGLGAAPPPLQQVGSATDWSQVSFGGSFIISSGARAGGIRQPGTLWHFDDKLQTTQIGAEADWKQVSLAKDHACGLRGTGSSLWCVKPFVPTKANPPQQIGQETDWTFVVSASEYMGSSGKHPAASYGIRKSGTLWTWDADSAAPTPTEIGKGKVWTAVDVGAGIICGLAADKSLWCWGTSDLRHYIQTGEFQSSPSPVQIGTDKDWTSVRTSNAHVCAIKTDQSLWCWGLGENGELGLGDAWREQPVQAK